MADPAADPSDIEMDEEFEPRTNEGTQTSIQETYVIRPEAAKVWLIAKKHRTYEQRARLRAAHIQASLKASKTPMWALRRDYNPKPPYLEFTAGMDALQRRHP